MNTIFRINTGGKISYLYGQKEIEKTNLIVFKSQTKVNKLILISYIRKYYFNASIREIINKTYIVLFNENKLIGVSLKL